MSLDCPRQVAVPMKHSCISASPLRVCFPWLELAALGISSRLRVELAFLAPFSTGIMVAGHQCVCVCVESDFLVS